MKYNTLIEQRGGKHMIISIGGLKASNKIQHPFMIKKKYSKNKEWKIFNVIKGTYEKLPVNITLDGKGLQAFPLRLEIRHRCPLSPVFFNTIGSSN